MKKNDFFEDLGIKVVALFLSLIIWFHATTEKNYTQIIELPVHYSYSVSDSLVLISTPPRKVRLRINAKGKTILKLKYTKSFYEVDVGRLDMGKNIIDMSQGAVPQVEDLEIMEVIPRKVLFLVDRYSTKVLYSIKPVFVYDSLKTKVSVDRIRPRTVRVRGPRTILRTMRFVTTDTVSLDTFKTGRYRIDVKLRTNLKYVSILKPQSVEIYFTVTRFVYDTVEVKTSGGTLQVFLVYPDTVGFQSDSLECTVDSVSRRPVCRTPSMVQIQKIMFK